jgi:hypothetical protein
VKKMFFIWLLMLFSFAAFAATATKVELPQGAYVKNHKVFVKKGFVVEKVSKNRAVIRKMRGNGITGSFDCTCNGNDGGCDVITTPTSVSCAVSTCKSSCYMITTIPGKDAVYLFRK